MSKRELERYAHIKRVVGKVISQSFAATQPGLVVRQIKRLCVAYRAQGGQA